MGKPGRMLRSRNYLFCCRRCSQSSGRLGGRLHRIIYQQDEVYNSMAIHSNREEKGGKKVDQPPIKDFIVFILNISMAASQKNGYNPDT